MKKKTGNIVKRDVKVINHMKTHLSVPRFANTFQNAWDTAEAITNKKGRNSITHNP